MKKNIGQKQIFKGSHIEVFNQKIQFEKNGVFEEYEIETARRTPSVRAIIVDKQNKAILLTKEYRTELEDWDFRLPGGKVFDKLDVYLDYINKKIDILPFADKKVDEEVLEEAGIIVKNKYFFHKSITGISIVWDLYYYVIDQFELGKQQVSEVEYIEPIWIPFDAIERMCITMEISEERSALVLLKFLKSI